MTPIFDGPSRNPAMMLSTYQSYLFYTNNPTQSLARTAAEPTVARAQKYYQANIGKVKTVDDFINNYQLFSYAMTAHGLQDFTYGKAFMKKVLESDLSDKNSFVNKLTDTRYKAFAEAFSFSTKGTVVDTTAVQSTDQENDTLGLYSQATASDPIGSAIETKYMQDNLGSVTSIDSLMQNTRLFGDVLTAYGIDPTTSASTIKSALESDVSDTSSFVNQSGSSALQKLAADFNFTSTGTITNQRLAQTQANFSAMATAYTALAGSDATAKAKAATETTYVGTAISKVTSLDGLLSDSRVVAYIGKAFGVPNISATTLRKVLTSNVSDPKSAANKLGASYANIAAAFDFTTSGTIAREPARQAQSKASLAATNSGYLQQTLETEAGADNAGVQLALYFQRKAPGVTNAYSILADPALLKVAQTLLSLPSASSTTNIDLQAKRITEGINLKDFQDPAKLNKLVSRFAVLYDLNNPSSQQNDMVTLFGGSTSA